MTYTGSSGQDVPDDDAKASEIAKTKELLSKWMIQGSFLQRLVATVVDELPAQRKDFTRERRVREAMGALLGSDSWRGGKGKDEEWLVLWMAVQYIKTALSDPAIMRSVPDGSDLVDVYLRLEEPPPLPDGPPLKFSNRTELAKAAITYFDPQATTFDRAQTQRLITKFRVDQDSLAGAFASPDTSEQRRQDRILKLVARALHSG